MLDFSASYFELLGLPVSYEVDQERLSQRYRDLQRELHPDRFASGTDQERRISMQSSSHLNEAYSTLRDPLERARYMLELNGVDMGATCRTTQDPEFLMEQMELREELGNARSEPDPYQSISGLMVGLDRRLEIMAEEMAGYFVATTPEKLKAATELMLKMQFLRKLRHDAEQLEAELDETL